MKSDNRSGDVAADLETDRELSQQELRASVRGGTRAVLAAQVASQLIALGALAILFRMVAPAEFGLLGMAVPLLSLARMLASLGLNVATVQRATLSEDQLSALFWVNLLAGVAATLVTAAGGPMLAWAYGTPELTMLCAALSGTLLLAALGAQHQALLERRLALGRLAACRIAGQLMGAGGAVAAAAAGWGVWALVVQQYVELVILVLAVWLLADWRPTVPRRWLGVPDLLRFGGFFAASNVMFFLALNLDKVLLAALLGRSPVGQAALGMYTQAFNLMFRPVYLVINPLAGVMLPGLSRAANNREEYGRMVAGFYRLIGIALFPCGIGLWLVARDGMRVLGGPNWIEAGFILEAFAPAILVQGFISLAGSVFASVGRADRLFWGSLVVTLLLVQGYAAGFYLGGYLAESPWGPTRGVAWSYSLVNLLVLAAPYLLYCFQSVGVPWRRVLLAVRGPALAAAMMGLLVAALGIAWPNAWGLGWKLLAQIAAGVVAYVGFAWRELQWFRRELLDRRETPLDATSR